MINILTKECDFEMANLYLQENINCQKLPQYTRTNFTVTQLILCYQVHVLLSS